jgi:hypothetical protein
VKYRRLNKEELAPLNEEFLKYLMVANITPENWELLKTNEPNKCEHHLDVFSDLVFDKILSDIQFVERALPKRLEVYHFLSEYVIMYALEAKSNEDFSFDKANLDKLPLKDFRLIEGKKQYQADKNIETFKILQQEYASISNGTLFKQLALKVVEQKEQAK